MKMLKRKVTDVTSKVVCGGEGCIGWMTNIVVTGGERYKSESMSGNVRVKHVTVFRQVTSVECYI